MSRTQGRVTRMDSRYICGIALVWVVTVWLILSCMPEPTPKPSIAVEKYNARGQLKNACTKYLARVD